MGSTVTEIQFSYKRCFADSSAKILSAPTGSTVAHMIAVSGIPPQLSDNIRVFIGDRLIERDQWGLVRPKEGSCVFIGVAPTGDVLKLAAIIAVSVFAPQIAAGLNSSLGLGLSQTGLSILSAGVGLVGNMLVNALFPPPSTSGVGSVSSSESPALTISGQSNSKNPYGPVTRIYGTHKVYPNLAADPYTQISGDTQFLYMIYDFGYGPVDIEDIRIGNTPIAQYDGVDYFVRDDTNFTLYTNDVASESIGSALNENGDEQIRSTASDANGFEIDFNFPSGLVGLNQDGSKSSSAVEFRVQYKKTTDSEWINATDSNYYKSGSNVSVADSSDIVLVPKEYSITFAYYGEDSFSDRDAYIGFDLRDDNSVIEYSSGTPEVGKYLQIDGSKYKIKSFTGSTLTVQGSSNKHVPIAQCRKEYGAGYSWVCPAVSNYTAKITSLATDGAIRITEKRQNPVFVSFGVSGLESDDYDVKITRLKNYNGGDFQNLNDATWNILRTFKDSVPVSVKKPHTFLEMRIKATDELSGVVQNLSAICTSKLNVYDGSEWTFQRTGNPAWVFADIISGSAVNKPLSLDRLDTDSLLHWAEFCAEEPVSGEGPRYSCNFVVDYNTTAKELLNQVTSAGRATMAIDSNGRYGVAIDEEKTIPVQQFTQRNSWGFSSSRTYIDEPQAIKVKFVDPDNDWNVRERIVYNDGYDELNTTEFEEMDAFGCTNANQAYRYGRYMMAQGILRQEKISISTDLENLICTRGDLVRFSHDVMKVGGLPARITGISGNTITIDENWVPVAGTYAYEHRYQGAVNLGSVVSIDSADTITLDDASNMRVGDLIVLGLVDNVSIDCLVQSIEPNSDYTADLTLVEYAPAIFTADTEEIPAYDPQESDGAIGATVVVDNLTATESLTFNTDGTANEFITLEWDDNSLIYNSDIWLSTNGEDAVQLSSDVTNNSYVYEVDDTDLDLDHTFYVDARNAIGFHQGYLISPSVSITPVGDNTPPVDVENFRMSVIKETIQLEWGSVVDESLSHYEIRYNPKTSGATWGTSQVLIDRVSKNLTSVAVSSRVGTYFIKAVDGSGNYSETAGQARTTIPILTDLNVIDTQNDYPLWNGAKTNCVVEGNNLVLRSTGTGYEISGWYEYENIFDLGEIYTSRISNKIELSGRSVADLLSNWTTLSDVNMLQTSKDSDYGAKVFVRSASSLDSISEWATLDSVEFLAQSSNWTEWRELTTGDYTGRYFQFAIQLTGNGLTTPVVRSGLIEIDMPDRTDSDNDIISGTGVYSVDYTPSFRAKPSVQITMDSAETGDYFVITDSDRTGFNIQFFNSSDVAISRQFDWTAKGYGAQAAEVI